MDYRKKVPTEKWDGPAAKSPTLSLFDRLLRLYFLLFVDIQNKSSPGILNGSGTWRTVNWMAFLFVAILVVQISLRIVFPWDMYSWPESPFLTDMLKLDHGQSIYGPPGDGNSAVYSPGLAYLTHALLKPFGLELDIRYCRLVTVSLGLLAAVCASGVMIRFLRKLDLAEKPRWLFATTLAIACLAVAKNPLADVPHPDNLHALHLLAVFWLCYTAVETRRFDFAVYAVILAGLGVLTKQTNALCFLGPMLAFALLRPWGLGRWCALLTLGGVVLAGALYLLWLPQYARFYTFDLLRSQGIYWHQLRRLPVFLLTVDRGLFVLAPVAVLGLWRAGMAGRRYLVCWAGVGFFSVLPNLSAYLKVNGTWNNLNLFEIWGVLVVWPFVLVLLNRVRNPEPRPGMDSSPYARGLLATHLPKLVLVVFALYLLPTKLPMRSVHYQFCRDLEAAVRRDVLAGRKVLVSHGTEFLIRAGATEIPKDRSNSLLEYNAANAISFSEMPMRIRARYYDRIYLVMGNWYGKDLLQEINQNYEVESLLAEPSPAGMILPFGFQRLMGGCTILVPRKAVAAAL